MTGPHSGDFPGEGEPDVEPAPQCAGLADELQRFALPDDQPASASRQAIVDFDPDRRPEDAKRKAAGLLHVPYPRQGLGAG